MNLTLIALSWGIFLTSILIFDGTGHHPGCRRDQGGGWYRHPHAIATAGDSSPMICLDGHGCVAQVVENRHVRFTNVSPRDIQHKASCRIQPAQEHVPGHLHLRSAFGISQWLQQRKAVVGLHAGISRFRAGRDQLRTEPCAAAHDVESGSVRCSDDLDVRPVGLLPGGRQELVDPLTSQGQVAIRQQGAEGSIGIAAPVARSYRGDQSGAQS